MIKKASTIVLALALIGLANWNSPIAVEAKAKESNPFTKEDKIRSETISTIKGQVEDRDLKDKKSLEEKRIKQKNQLSALGKRYIVKFSSSASLEKIYKVVSKYEYKILGKSEQRIFLVNLKDVEGFKKQALGLVESFELDSEMKMEAVPKDPEYENQWGLPAINMPKAWDISKGSESVFVAVIDSGIYREHPDFNGVDIRNGADIVFGGPCHDDLSGHGTSVTGVIGAQTNNKVGIAGVNWDVAIVPLNVSFYSGKSYSSDVIKAIYLAADAGCKVINLSLGSPNYSTQANAAIQYALSKGCIVVAAAGNSGNSVKMYPASYDGVISVGSINSELSKSDFSNYNNKIDVVAPGEDVLTTTDWQYSYYGEDYEYVNGTSFSSPHVAGVAGLVASLDPSITPAKFQKLIETTSKDLGAKGYDNYYGFGLIDAEKVLKSVEKTPKNSPLK